MIILIEAWLLELAKGIGRVFLNPLLYWTIILIIISGYLRIKKERKQFGLKIFDYFTEWKDTWFISLIAGIFISLLTIGIGIVFTYESILVLSVVTIILSLTFTFSMLSASYTIGLTYIILLLSPLLLSKQTLIDADLFKTVNFTSLTVLLGLLLLVEAVLLFKTKRNQTYPDLSLSERGNWIGQHRIKKLTLIPFFVIIPSGMITPFAPYWPYFEIGGETYSLLLVPFLLGFNHLVRGSLSEVITKKLSKSIAWLGVVILLLAAGSLYYAWLTIIAVILAILGREYIHFKHKTVDKQELAYFRQMESGLTVLGVIPGTPADRLDILVGEKITKVNGERINDVDSYYQLLQESGAYFKLEVIDDIGEMRFVEGAFYEGDHHRLGVIFTEKPYRIKRE